MKIYGNCLDKVGLKFRLKFFMHSCIQFNHTLIPSTMHVMLPTSSTGNGIFLLSTITNLIHGAQQSAAFCCLQDCSSIVHVHCKAYTNIPYRGILSYSICCYCPSLQYHWTAILFLVGVQPFFDYTVLSALSPPHTSRAPGAAAQDKA